MTLTPDTSDQAIFDSAAVWAACVVDSRDWLRHAPADHPLRKQVQRDRRHAENRVIQYAQLALRRNERAHA